MSWIRTLMRGFAGRCPNCGERAIFRRWVQLRERCPRCGIYFEREEGYWTGAIGVNTVVTSLVFVAAMVGGMWWTWPNVPVARLLSVTLVLNTLFPILFYPFSKTIWMALDFVLHPLEPEEEWETEVLRRLREHPGNRP